MKQRILKFISVILSISLLLAGCGNNKQNNIDVETTANGTVKLGKYTGEPYKLTSSFIPILTLENNNKFKFELGSTETVEGTYKVDNSKLVLISTNGDNSYKFGISNNDLVIEQEIPKYVKSNTRFKSTENK